MNWILISSALAAALMAAAGLGLLLPIGRTIEELCEFGAVGLVMVFVGLADGA
jgi:hypothetical protein